MRYFWARVSPAVISSTMDSSTSDQPMAIAPPGVDAAVARCRATHGNVSPYLGTRRPSAVMVSRMPSSWTRRREPSHHPMMATPPPKTVATTRLAMR